MFGSNMAFHQSRQSAPIFKRLFYKRVRLYSSHRTLMKNKESLTVTARTK